MPVWVLERLYLARLKRFRQHQVIRGGIGDQVSIIGRDVLQSEVVVNQPYAVCRLRPDRAATALEDRGLRSLDDRETQ